MIDKEKMMDNDNDNDNKVLIIKSKLEKGYFLAICTDCINRLEEGRGDIDIDISDFNVDGPTFAFACEVCGFRYMS